MTNQELNLPVPVLVVEDEPLVQNRLKDILIQIGFKVQDVIFAQDIAQAKKMLLQHSASFALVDLGLPDGNGTEFIQHLKAYDDSIPILVISAWCTEEAIFNALKAGATGYVLKERDDLEISMSIRSALRGGAPIDPFIALKILKYLDLYKENTPYAQDDVKNSSILTTREHEILLLVSTGLSNKEIAEKLNLSRYTVESHIKHIYRKLAVSTRTKAVDTARSMGLLN